jgi:uncharacterized protein
MSDFNAENNRAVWFDIPVVDLKRASAFYAAVLGCRVEIERFDGWEFAVIEHMDGNGGCLVPSPDEIAPDKGVMLYLNVNGRIRDAAAQVDANGGTIVEDVHPIGPHGFRAIVRDSEGNRMVLHSRSDA